MASGSMICGTKADCRVAKAPNIRTRDIKMNRVFGIRRNKVAERAQNGKLTGTWFWRLFVVVHISAGWQGNNAEANSFLR